MPLVVVRRTFDLFTVRKKRFALLQTFVNTIDGVLVPERSIIVRNHYVVRTGSRKKTLTIGLLQASRINRNVLLYRKLQPAAHLAFPIFTPWKRRVKALGQIIAPVVVVGVGGANMDLQHFLGLSLMKLGGMRY